MPMEEKMTAIVMKNAYGCGGRSSTHSSTPWAATGKIWPNGGLSALVRGPEAFFALLLCWQARAAERRRLLQLDDRLLSDIGVSHAEARAEAAKPFWRA